MGRMTEIIHFINVHSSNKLSERQTKFHYNYINSNNESLKKLRIEHKRNILKKDNTNK
jgi:hypothetical protein